MRVFTALAGVAAEAPDVIASADRGAVLLLLAHKAVERSLVVGLQVRRLR
jgi:hypothetical protein